MRRYGEQAKQLVLAEFAKNVIALALKYGIRSAPQLNDPTFVSQIVFDDTKGPGVPKARFAYIFPNKSSALIQVRFRPDLSEGQRDRAIDLVRRAVAMPDWKLPNGKGTYVVTGAPVVVSDLTKSISHSLIVLLAGGARRHGHHAARWSSARGCGCCRSSSPLAAAGLTFGALSLTGASLTMASIAVLPVLIGLAVDYAIQLQARVQEAQAAGDGIEAAVARTAQRGAPTVATAAAATAAGFLVLALSPVPMVRGFGLLLVAGIALALGCALTLGRGARSPPRRAGAPAARDAGPGARVARRRRAARRQPRRPRGAPARRRGRARRAARWRRRTRAASCSSRSWSPSPAGASRRRRAWSPTSPSSCPRTGAIHDLQALQRSTGVGGEIDVVVSGPRVTDPAVVKWMTRYQSAVLKRFGYSDKRGCGKAELCPAFSLPDLFRSSPKPPRQQIEGLLDAVPPYFSQGVITADRRTATLAFGIRLMPLDRQQDVIDAMRAASHPPAGVTAPSSPACRCWPPRPTPRSPRRGGGW